MNFTISEITENIKKVGQRIFEANGNEFKRGFNICFGFFEEQLNKTTLCHQSILVEEIRELEKKNLQIEQMTKVSFAGQMAIENQEIKDICSKNKQLENQVLQLQKQLNKQKDENTRLYAQIKLATPKTQNNFKVDKKYKKVMDFISYYGLEEPFKEFSSSFLQEKSA